MLRFLRSLLNRMSLLPRLLISRLLGRIRLVRLTLKFVLLAGGRERSLLLLLQLRRLNLRGDGELILKGRYLTDGRCEICLLHIVVHRFFAYQPISGHRTFTLRILAKMKDYYEL